MFRSVGSKLNEYVEAVRDNADGEPPERVCASYSNLGGTFTGQAVAVVSPGGTLPVTTYSNN
jgi:hypothetical protein